MAAHILRLIIIMATFCALAVPGLAFAKCETEVTLDQQLRELRDQKLRREIDENEFEAAVTLLLNEAFTPYLVYLSELIMKVPNEEIQRTAEVFKSEIAPGNHAHDVAPKSSDPDFNGTFSGFRKGLFGGVRPRHMSAAFTEFNSLEMYNLLVAVKTMSYLEDKYSKPEEVRSITESRRLREQMTFSKDQLSMQMHYAYLSSLQSVAALTADKVEGWTARSMVLDVISPGHECLGVAAIHSVRAPPRLLGANGTYFYRKNPVEEKDGRLVMTDDFIQFLKEKRKQFPSQYIKREYEHMHGCPVAHKSEGLSDPGLQHFLTALKHVYEVIK